MSVPLLSGFCHPLSDSDLAGMRSGEGLWGEPPIPDCAPYGYMTEHYNCSCWDNTVYKGPTCRESCVQ